MITKIDNYLVNRMDVFSPSTGLSDDDTGTPDQSLTLLIANVPCRLDPGRGREFKVGKRVVIADYMIFSRAVAGMTEACTIVLGTHTFDILGIDEQQDGAGVFHHLEIFVEEIVG